MKQIILAEETVDRHIENVIRYHKGSDTSLKCACIAASPIVGTYSDGTAQIAKQTRRSVSTVENWAHAHWAYCEYRGNGHKKTARFLWREMTTYHWVAAWDIHAAGYDAIHYLSKAHEGKWSSREMSRNFDADRNAGQAPLIFHRAKRALFGLANELVEKYRKELTEHQLAILALVLDGFGESGTK